MRVSQLGPRFVELSHPGHDDPYAGSIVFDNERGAVVLLQHPHGLRGSARIEAEADAFARLDHPCISPLLDRGVTERGIPFYTQPAALVHARPLDLLLLFQNTRWPATLTTAKRDSLTLREHVRILIDVSDALRVVHHAGFLHLQLSPFVIHVTHASHGFVSGGQHHGPPVFIATNSTLDDPNPCFAAPEQLDMLSQARKGAARYCADAFDARADVYALGSLLHWLIYDTSEKSGRRIPQYRTTQMRIAKTWPLRQPAAQDDRLVRQLEPIWRWAMAPDRSNRLPNASAFARELRQALWRDA